MRFTEGLSYSDVVKKYYYILEVRKRSIQPH